MVTQEIAVASNVNVLLESTSLSLDEVVVTAIGMKKNEKALGYASTTVKSDELIAAKSGSLMSGMMGKVAGVNISNAGGTGTAQKVVIRGISSFNSNQPLYVIDGVPIENNFSGENTLNNTIDFGNAANDINPDDVESVTILKGASATALYGSRAANGVIMITTKRANSEKLTINYDGSFMASNVLRVPQTQDKFGQGWPDWNPMENGSWGPALNGREHLYGPYSDDDYDFGLTPLSKPFSYVNDNIRNFYENGFESNNNVSVRMGNENLGLVASYGNLTSSGVLPMDAEKFKRNTFSLRGNAKYNKFSADISLNYVRKDINRPSTGQGGDGATMFQEILQHAVDMDISAGKDYNDPYYNTDNYYTPYATNPYWVLAHNKNKYQDDRVYGKIELSYNILDWLTAIGRLGGDYTNSRQDRMNEKVTYTPDSWSYLGQKQAEPGTYTVRDDYYGQVDATALLNANYNITPDISLGGMIGWNLNQRNKSHMESYLYGLQAPGWFSLENGATRPITESIREKRRLIGLFGQVEFGYKNFWFINLSARNDWSSTLPKGKNSFFYGGINSSLIITDMLEELKSDYLNFLKIRGAWGKTGNDALVYRTAPYYIPSQISLGFGDLYLPINGVMGLTEFNRLHNVNLKPEITTEWEIGVTSYLLKNRLIIDFAYYDKLTKDQIISASLAPETRYTSMTRNVGEIANWGIEMAVSGIPVQTRDFEWELGVTFTKNWSEVKKLWDDVNEYVMQSIYQVDFVAEVGQPVNVFKVPSVAKTEDGKTIVTNAGLPQLATDEKDVIGSSNPNFRMGFNTKLSYKGFTLGAVVDWLNGGYFYSYTAQLLTFAGNSTYTVYNDRQTFVIPNSVRVVDGKYVENNIPITTENMYSYYNNASNYDQYRNWVLKKDYVKLRELTLSYTFPRKLLTKTPVSALELTLIGRNLFMWTPKSNNYVDPESTNYGNDIRSEVGEFATAPSTRTFGGGIKVTF